MTSVIELDKDKLSIMLSQQQYFEDVIADFRPISIPALTNEHFIKLD